MNTFTLPFTDVKATLSSVGGKGANLSRMARAGFPIPPGFFITTEAYRAVVQANHLQQKIVDLATNTADTSDAKSLAIRKLFAKASLPVALIETIISAHIDLKETVGDVPLAVRSSATAEDLPGASFAGQQESYLDETVPFLGTLLTEHDRFQAVLREILEEHDGLTVGEVYSYVCQRHDDPVIRHYLSMEYPDHPMSLQQIITVNLTQMGYTAQGPKRKQRFYRPANTTYDHKRRLSSKPTTQ